MGKTLEEYKNENAARGVAYQKGGRLGHHVIEDDSRIQNVVRIEQLLELPHELVRLGSPLHLNKRSHVPASPMLSLQCKHI